MHVQLTARARKDLDRLPSKQRLRVLRALKRIESSSLADATGFKHIEGIPGPDLYRLRVGSYRVLCAVESDVTTILRVITRQDLEKAIRQLTGR